MYKKFILWVQFGSLKKAVEVSVLCCVHRVHPCGDTCRHNCLITVALFTAHHLLRTLLHIHNNLYFYLSHLLLNSTVPPVPIRHLPFSSTFHFNPTYIILSSSHLSLDLTIFLLEWHTFKNFASRLFMIHWHHVSQPPEPFPLKIPATSGFYKIPKVSAGYDSQSTLVQFLFHTPSYKCSSTTCLIQTFCQ